VRPVDEERLAELPLDALLKTGDPWRGVVFLFLALGLGAWTVLTSAIRLWSRR